MVGIEPTTDGLQNRCSTTELHWQSDADFPSARAQGCGLLSFRQADSFLFAHNSISIAIPFLTFSPIVKNYPA